MNDRIEIHNYDPEVKGSLVGKFDLTMKKWGVVIKRMCHFRKDGREWVGMPTIWLQTGDQGKYEPALEFIEKSHETEFKRIVLEELKKIR